MKERIVKVADLEGFLRTVVKRILLNPLEIRNGREIKPLNLRPREVLGLFFVCVVGRYISGEDWTIGNDMSGRDGVIVCDGGKRDGEAFATEQVYVYADDSGDLTDLVISRIRDKIAMGVEYCKNLHLIVFCDKNGKLDHQRIKKEITDMNRFYSYWLVSKYSQDEWKYFVASLKTITDPVVAYEVDLMGGFQSWRVRVLGRL